MPGYADLRALAEAAAHCRGCDLYQEATQTVFGRGTPVECEPTYDGRLADLRVVRAALT